MALLSRGGGWVQKVEYHFSTEGVHSNVEAGRHRFENWRGVGEEQLIIGLENIAACTSL
jgi:hypothetical protein